MNRKEKAKQLLAQVKKFKDNEKAKTNELKKLLNENESNNKKGVNMKLTKQNKHTLELIKMLGRMEAKANDSQLSEEQFLSLVEKYNEAAQEKGMQTKGIELTSDHTNLLRVTQSSDIILSFDGKDEASSILALFNRYDLPVNGKVTIPVDNQNVELEHYAETADIVEQTWDESLLTLEASRAAFGFKLSRSLQFKSIVDQVAYLESLMTLAIAKGLVEGIINGQGASSATQDSGYAAKKMGNKMAGIRAKLAEASYTYDADKKELDATDGKAVLQAMFDAAGARFSRNQSRYVILCARKEKLLISELIKGTGVTGINTAAASQVYATQYQGVPVIETGFLISRTASSGSGYGETGFVKSATTHNDHGSLILLDPSQVWYHFGGERTDVSYVSKSDSFEIDMNAQAGWNMLCDSRNQPGVLVKNIGADIGVDA